MQATHSLCRGRGRCGGRWARGRCGCRTTSALGAPCGGTQWHGWRQQGRRPGGLHRQGANVKGWCSGGWAGSGRGCRPCLSGGNSGYRAGNEGRQGENWWCGCFGQWRGYAGREGLLWRHVAVVTTGGWRTALTAGWSRESSRRRRRRRSPANSRCCWLWRSSYRHGHRRCGRASGSLYIGCCRRGP
jgi:hypothetical protein